MYTSAVCPRTNVCVDMCSLLCRRCTWVWAVLLTGHPSCPFCKFLRTRARCLGPCGAEQGATSSWGTGCQDVRSCRELGGPLSPVIPPCPCPLPPSNQGLRSNLGGCRGLGCHLSVPCPACSLPLELLSSPSPSPWDSLLPSQDSAPAIKPSEGQEDRCPRTTPRLQRKEPRREHELFSG